MSAPGTHSDHVGAVLALAGAQARAARRRDALLILGGRALLLFIILAGWQLASGPLIDRSYVSRPTDIAAAWWALAENGTIWNETRYTLTEFIAGFAIGSALGILMACLLTIRDFHYRVLEPYLFVLFTIPKLAIAPLLGLWFGLGMTPKIVLAAMVTFLLTLMNSVAGIRAVNPQMLAVLRIMGASRAQSYFQLTIPQALPFVLTALRVAIPFAMVAVILAEFIGSMGGLGHAIAEQATFLAIDNMMALIVTLAVLVTVFRLALLPLESWVKRHQFRIRGV